MPRLEIQLLGDFRLHYDEKPVTTLNTPRLQTFMAYLVLHKEAPQPRQKLAFLFWPDTTESQARTNLRNLLHIFRRALPDVDRFLHSNRQSLQWAGDGSYSLDVGNFEAAMLEAMQAQSVKEEETALAAAIELYRGDLLAGSYEDWILPVREKLRETYSNALARLVELREAARQYPEAIAYAHRLLRHDPLHEASYRRLMRLHALNQDPAGALRTYHTCVSTLQRELGVDPSPVTQEAFKQLLNLETAPDPESPATNTPLVGRETEWEHLRGQWRRASRGRLRFVLLTGEAGIGKTRLAEELIVWTGRQGIPTMQAYCFKSAGDLAYAPITEWLRSIPVQEAVATLDPIWLSELARLQPELLRQVPGLAPPEPLTENWQRQRLHEAMARGLLAVPQPFLLFLDNLQWADPETLNWLHFLLRFKPQARFLILGTMRVEEIAPDHPLETLRLDLQRLDLLDEVPLGPLDESATGDLARHIKGYPLERLERTRIFEETEGNPLFITEMSRVSSTSGNALTPRLQAIIDGRLNLLSPAGRQLAGLAASIGRSFTLNVLSKASPMGEDQLVQALDELWTRRIIREQGLEAYDFSHERLREVAYRKLSLARRRLYHRRIAAALVAVHADDLDSAATQIAVQAAEAGQLDEAAGYFQRAAEAAKRLYANQEATDLYRKAIEALGMDAGEPESGTEHTRQLCELHEGLGEVLQLIGDYKAARKEFLSGLALAGETDLIQRAGLLWRIGETWRESYHPVEALPHYQEAENLLDSLPERSTAWWHLWIEIQQARAWVDYRLSRLDEMEARVEVLRDLVQEHGSPRQRAIYYNFLIATSNLRDRFMVSEQEVKFAEASLAARQEIGSPVGIAEAQFSLGFELLWFGDLERAEANLLAALKTFENVGYRLMQSRSLAYLTTLYRLQGDESEVRKYNDLNLAIAGEINIPDYLGMAQAHAAWLAWRGGELEAAESLSNAALDTWSREPPYPIQWAALWVVLAIAYQRRDFEAAAGYASKLLASGQQQLPGQISRSLETSVQAWQQEETKGLDAYLNTALQLAGEHGFL